MFGRPRAFAVASLIEWNSLPTPGPEIRMSLKQLPVFVKDAANGTERIRQFLMMHYTNHFINVDIDSYSHS